MDDDQLIITTSLSYLIISLILHIIFFATRIFDHKYRVINRYFKQANENNMNSDDIPSLNEQTCDEISFYSSLTSDNILQLERILNRTIRSFSLLLCTCLLITNWLRLGLIYLFPKIYSYTIQSSLNFCIIQSFFLHVLTIFYLHLIICLRLFWHYCFIFDKYCQTITYRRILSFLLFIFICLCLFTLPSISNEWASIIFDQILQICIVNYAFNYSYTFFILTLTCLIPFIILIISHKRQMKDIENRISKYISIDQKFNFSYQKMQFQYSSYMILIWSFFNILLLIFLHIPIKSIQIRTIVYYIQIISFLLDPILYIFMFRSLSIINLLRPINEIYFK